MKTLVTNAITASTTAYFGSAAKVAMNTVELQKRHNVQVDQLLVGKDISHG